MVRPQFRLRKDTNKILIVDRHLPWPSLRRPSSQQPTTLVRTGESVWFSTRTGGFDLALNIWLLWLIYGYYMWLIYGYYMVNDGYYVVNIWF